MDWPAHPRSAGCISTIFNPWCCAATTEGPARRRPPLRSQNGHESARETIRHKSRRRRAGPHRGAAALRVYSLFDLGELRKS